MGARAGAMCTRGCRRRAGHPTRIYDSVRRAGMHWCGCVGVVALAASHSYLSRHFQLIPNTPFTTHTHHVSYEEHEHNRIVECGQQEGSN
jgi:hypothetical protein